MLKDSIFLDFEVALTLALKFVVLIKICIPVFLVVLFQKPWSKSLTFSRRWLMQKLEKYLSKEFPIRWTLSLMMRKLPIKTLTSGKWLNIESEISQVYFFQAIESLENYQEEVGCGRLLSDDKTDLLMRRWRFPSLSIHGIHGYVQ